MNSTHVMLTKGQCLVKFWLKNNSCLHLASWFHNMHASARWGGTEMLSQSKLKILSNLSQLIYSYIRQTYSYLLHLSILIPPILDSILSFNSTFPRRGMKQRHFHPYSITNFNYSFLFSKSSEVRDLCLKFFFL